MSDLTECPTCSHLLVFPRGDSQYCEDCGWPNEDFGEEFSYPKDGDQLGGIKGLEFFNGKKWVKSGVITATMRDHAFLGLYRYPFN